MFRKSSGIEKLLDNKVARFCRLFLSHSAEKFVENPPRIQKKLGHPKNLCIMVEFHDFPLRTFSLRVSKNIVGERF